MRVSDSIIMAVLNGGGSIRTSWHAPASTSGQQIPRIPEGYLLVSADGRDETILSQTDFLSVADRLREVDSWAQVAGVTLFGGSTWQLRDMSSDV